MTSRYRYSISEAALRNVVRQILTEDDGGFDFGGAGDWGGYGMGSAWPGSLYDIFAKPFVDVGKTTLAAVEDVTSKTQQVIETVVQGLPTLVLPFVAAEYDKIKKAESRRAEQIKSKYSDVFQANDDAFKGDAQGFAFMMAPVHYLNKTILQNTSGAIAEGTFEGILRVLETVSGRSDFIQGKVDALRQYAQLREQGETDEIWNALRGKLGDSLGMSGLGEASAVGAVAGFVAPLDEDDDDGNKAKLPSLSDVLRHVMNDDEMQQELKGLDTLDDMKEETRTMISTSLMAMKKNIERYKSIDSLKDLEKVLHTNKISAGLRELDDEQREPISKIILNQARKGMVSTVKTQLKREINWLKEQGIDEAHPYITAYKNLLQSL